MSSTNREIESSAPKFIIVEDGKDQNPQDYLRKIKGYLERLSDEGNKYAGDLIHDFFQDEVVSPQT